MRRISAAALAAVAVALMVIAIPRAITALRARGAVVSSCDDSLATLPFGAWVRLKGCRVDMFQSSFLDDAAGTRSHRLVPLRGPDESAAERSRLALAIAAKSASDPNVFRNTPRPDSGESQVADLGETVGVVWSNLDRLGLTHALVTVPGIDTGLIPSPVLIEVREAPSLRRTGGLILTALIAIAVAMGMFAYRPTAGAARSRAPIAPQAPPRRDVRWGLVFVTVLVGMVAMVFGLAWYFDPMRQTAWEMAAQDVPPASSTSTGERAAPVLPIPTPEELADLRSSDPVKQLIAADTLLNRTVTTDLMTAVESALQADPAPRLEAQLVCLKSRFEGPEILAFLLARFPRERKDLDWNLKPGVMCVLDALVAKAPEAPERVRDALMPAIYASSATTRGKALHAFRTMDLPQIPATLVAEASTRGAPFQREALQAAVALGGLRLNPALVAGAIRDPYTSALVTSELVTDPHANAARIVANVWAERSVESVFERLARQREAQMHDVSAALLEIVLDPAEPEGKRAAGAHQLELLADTGPLHALRELTPTLEPGRLKASVDAAIRVLEDHVQRGRRAQMRALPPKAAGRD